MLLDILPLKNNTARLIRVYGDEPCIAVPGEVPGPGGEKWTLTELGDYCFSEKLRNLPAADALCRYEVGGDGAVTLTRAFGRALTGRRRYDLDFGDAPEETDLHPVCGNFLEEAVLPDGLQVIGSCAFYNCRKLRLLTVGTGSLTMGSDVFLNCFALETIRVLAAPGDSTGLFALVNNITEAVRALFWLPGEARPRAGLPVPPRRWRRCGIPPTGRTSRRPPPTSCCTPFPGRDTITGSVFSIIYSSRQNMTASSRRATMPTMPM